MPAPSLLNRLSEVKARFDQLRVAKESLLQLLDESEAHEAVLFSTTTEQPLDLDRLRRLHQMLIGNIDDEIAGRFRATGEYVRVGTHIAPAPEAIEGLLEAMLSKYSADVTSRPTQRLARLHLEFERIHPFVDGNGRIGRVMLNDALYRLGFAPIIIRNKGKLDYYSMLRRYDTDGTIKAFEDHLVVLMLESLHRRTAYLAGLEIRPVAEVARMQGEAPSALLNKARRQSIPAFRERGVWKIGLASE